MFIECIEEEFAAPNEEDDQEPVVSQVSDDISDLGIIPNEIR